jgi:shikimate dehydrogenase
VLGSPIGHSLSPALHRAAYAQLGLDWRYDAIDCDIDQLPAMLDDAASDAAGFVGLSLTMPRKRAARSLLDDVTPLAAATGAVNTVSFGDDPMRRYRQGDNTDVGGLVGAIRAARTTTGCNIASAVVLGAGGTAAAAVAAVCQLGPRTVDVVVRDFGRATDLVAAAERLGIEINLVGWPGIEAVNAAELVISTVPAGAADVLTGSSQWAPGPDQLLFDVLYHPWPTPFAAAGHEAGAQVIGGLELLVRQAALQVERWTGHEAPIDVMRAAGLRALEARGRVG